MLKFYSPLFFLCLLPGALLADAASLNLVVTDLDTGEPIENATVILEADVSKTPINTDIIQKDRQFQPRSVVVPIGSSVNFPNEDVTQHHVYSFSPAKVIDIELYAGQPEDPVVFDTAGVVELGCNIHDQMQAFILVVDKGLTVQTDSDGKATLTLPDTLSSGEELKLGVWHPRMKNTAEAARFTVTQPAPTPLQLSVSMAPEPSANGRLDRLQQRFQDL